MFFVALTNRPLSRRLKDFKAIEAKLKCGRLVTVVTDDLLSIYVQHEEQLSIIESILPSSPEVGAFILSKADIDTVEGTIRLFRSTIGGRPIYYCINGDGEIFSSTHISMLRKAGVPIEENNDVLPEFFVYRYVMPPRTLFRNIRQLTAGSEVQITYREPRNLLVRIQDFQFPTFGGSSAFESIQNVAEHTLNLTNDALRPLIPVKDRIGFLLSGGLDSSILLQAARSNFSVPLTFSTGYPSQNTSTDVEKRYACSAATSFGIDHVHCEVSVDDYLNGFLDALEAAEEPLHHLQSVLLYLLFKRGLPTAKDIVISGQGADGVFGLHLHNFLHRTESPIFRLLAVLPLRELVELTGVQNRTISRYAIALTNVKRRNLPLADPNNITWLLGAYGRPEWVRRYFAVSNEDIIKGRYESIKMYNDRSIYDIISILDVKGDVSITTALWSKLGEQCKRILYCPFNSPEILEYVYRLPWNIKVSKPKNVLREMAVRLQIPRYIIDRPKSGFGALPEKWAPKGGWFEPLIPLAARVFPLKEITRLQSTDVGSAETFWSILNYSVWRRLVIDNESVERLAAELRESIERAQWAACRS